MSVPRGPSSHHPSMSSSFFLCFFLGFPSFFLYTIFPLCQLSPLSVPCNATDGLCERWGRSQRISIYLTPACPSSSSHSLIYHTQVLFIVVWQPALGPWLYLSLSAPLIITVCLTLLGISQRICIFSVLRLFVVVCETLLNLRACILSDIVIQQLNDQVKVIHEETVVIKAIVWDSQSTP